MKAKVFRVHGSHNMAQQVNFSKTLVNENVPWSGYIQATLSK